MSRSRIDYSKRIFFKEFLDLNEYPTALLRGIFCDGLMTRFKFFLLKTQSCWLPLVLSLLRQYFFKIPDRQIKKLRKGALPSYLNCAFSVVFCYKIRFALYFFSVRLNILTTVMILSFYIIRTCKCYTSWSFLLLSVYFMICYQTD